MAAGYVDYIARVLGRVAAYDRPVGGRHADSLRLTVPGTDVKHLSVVGSIPGVVPLLAAARCLPGTARVRSVGTDLRFKAPGSANYGPAVVAAVDGTYLLCDVADQDMWLRVAVKVDYLRAGPQEARVFLGDVYAGGTTDDDVTASEAAAGATSTYQIELKNASSTRLSRIRVWLDASTAGIEISDDGLAWVNPTTEATALDLPDLTAGASQTLYLRRTIGAAADSDPSVLDLVHWAFDGL